MVGKIIVGCWYVSTTRPATLEALPGAGLFFEENL
jgi:hypothetical protein